MWSSDGNRQEVYSIPPNWGINEPVRRGIDYPKFCWFKLWIYIILFIDFITIDIDIYLSINAYMAAALWPYCELIALFGRLKRELKGINWRAGIIIEGAIIV